MGKAFSEVKTGGNRDRGPRMDELVKVLDWSKVKGYVTLRFINPDRVPFVCLGQVWVTKEVERDGKVKEVKYPRLPFGWDPVACDFTADGKKKRDPFLAADCQFDRKYYVCAIVRDLQERNEKKYKKAKLSKKEKKTGFCDNIESADKTPIRVIRIPSMVVEKLGKLKM